VAAKVARAEGPGNRREIAVGPVRNGYLQTGYISGVNRFVDRLIAAFAALALLVAAQGAVRVERDASAPAFRAVSAAASFTALHSAPAHRLTLESRSATRWPSSTDVPMPTSGIALASETIVHRVAIATAIGRANAPSVARGYDATAPPALS
jgi:hypothetical protein